MSIGEVKELLQTGGITMVIIVLGSIAAVVIGVERFLFLRGFSQRAQELHEVVIRALLRGDAHLALHECDRQLGRLLTTLRETGQLTNTMIFVCGDHGQAGVGDVRGSAVDVDRTDVSCAAPGTTRANR